VEHRDSTNHDLLDATARVPDHVVFRSFEEETLLLNLESGQYHGLNPTGGRLIELLGGDGRPVREAIGVLAEEYEMPVDEIAGDLLAFCSELEGRGLLVVERGA
jgi:hypothetical protein